GLTRSKSRSVLVRASAKRSRSSCRTATSRCATGIFGSLQRDRAPHHASTLRCPRSLKGSGFCGFSQLERAPFPGQFCLSKVACISLSCKHPHVNKKRDEWSSRGRICQGIFVIVYIVWSRYAGRTGGYEA